MNTELEYNILVQNNSRMHKENCDLKHLTSNLTSKLKDFRSKVEQILHELNEIPQSFGLKNAFKITESEIFGHESERNDLENDEDDLKDLPPHPEKENIGGPSSLSNDNQDVGDEVDPGDIQGLPSTPLTINNPDEEDEGDFQDDIDLLDTSVNVEVAMTEEFPAFRKDLLSPEENIQIKTETDSHEAEKNQNSETKLSFPCTKCKYVCDTFEDLNKHTRRKHILGNVEKNSEGVYKCKMCDYVTRTRGKLMVHVQKHEGKVHRCSQCSYTSECESYLKIHIGKTHKQSFQCDKCEYSTKDKSRLKSHVKCRHDKLLRELKYNCDICDFKTHTNSYLKKHKQTHDGVLICCDQCPYSTPSETYMKLHKFRTHSDQTFSCDQCQSSFKVKDKLKNHIKYVHDKVRRELRYSCDACDYKTHSNSHLKKHTQTHSSLLKFCDQCPYSTPSEYNMKSHISRTHSKLTFFCDKCPFSCKVESGLKVHTKSIHEKGKILSIGKHKCDICNNNFCSASYLKLHMDSHNGITYYCDVCAYSNSSPHNLKKHKTQIHENKKRSCKNSN